MKNNRTLLKWILRTGSYVLVAALAAVLTLSTVGPRENAKLEQIHHLIENRYVGEYNDTDLYDGAAAGMIAATGDRWSYYIPASQYEQVLQSKENRDYVGIGITITAREEGGFEIVSVNPDGPAFEAGIIPGDIMIAAGGEDATAMTTDQVKEIIRGEENTSVTVGVLRGEEKMEFTVTRRSIPTIVAKGQMLPDHIGLVTINNFNDKCAAESINAIDELVEQGARGLVFDVRGNPGGSADELVKVLDHLLPEGPLFRSNETGKEEVVRASAPDCIKLPMAVIVNADSYSAAEFFAAALSEYDWATVVGEQTVGKSYFQYTYRLSDGSAVALSSGRYCTPKGVSLADVGGLTPDVQVALNPEEAKNLAYGQLAPEEDPQIRAAVESLGLS